MPAELDHVTHHLWNYRNRQSLESVMTDQHLLLLGASSTEHVFFKCCCVFEPLFLETRSCEHLAQVECGRRKGGQWRGTPAVTDTCPVFQESPG